MTVERFRPSGGQVVGWTGAAVLVALAGYLLVSDPSLTSVRTALGMLLAAALVWAVLLRPRAAVDHDEGVLVLRNPLRDTYLPLARIDRVTARQTLDVRVDEESYVCIGIGRTARQSLRHAAPNEPSGSPLQPPPPVQGAGESYVDFVVRRIGTLADSARRSAGGAEPPAVRRAWAVPEVVAIVVLGVAFVVSLLV